MDVNASDAPRANCQRILDSMRGIACWPWRVLGITLT